MKQTLIAKIDTEYQNNLAKKGLDFGSDYKGYTIIPIQDLISHYGASNIDLDTLLGVASELGESVFAVKDNDGNLMLGS